MRGLSGIFSKTYSTTETNDLFIRRGKAEEKGAHEKNTQVRMERDLFGRILSISMEKKEDIAHVLEYPLTPIPLCFFSHKHKENTPSS